MELTKYEHACFTVERDGKFIVVDPGNMTTDFVSPEGVVAVVVTHEHGDHFDHDQIASIIDKNPDAIIIGPSEVTSQIEVFETKAVKHGDSVSVGGFDLEFFGFKHDQIHPTMPAVANVGVLINELVYYPGDSFFIPDSDVSVLAIPTSGPWVKLGDAIDFMLAIAPQQAFSTHDIFHTAAGQHLVNDILKRFADNIQAGYHPLNPGESLTV